MTVSHWLPAICLISWLSVIPIMVRNRFSYSSRKGREEGNERKIMKEKKEFIKHFRMNKQNERINRIIKSKSYRKY
jgi:hypothetical protein